MNITDSQSHLVTSQEPVEPLLVLEGPQLLALYSLAQMHGKVVEYLDPISRETRRGVFEFAELNGAPIPSPSDEDAWRNVDLSSAAFAIHKVEPWGTSQFSWKGLPTQVKRIALIEGEEKLPSPTMSASV